FDLGGHSLFATKLTTRVNASFNVSLPLKCVFSAQTLQELAKEIQHLDRNSEMPTIQPMNTEQGILSYGQLRLWFLDQLDSNSTQYNMAVAFKVSGALQYAEMNKAFNSILNRHGVLRTVFKREEEAEPVQVLQSPQDYMVELNDVSEFAREQKTQAVTSWLEAGLSYTFDLEKDLMLKARVLKVAEDEHILQVLLHHIASDGWSMSILVKEFTALYSAYVDNKESPLPALEIQYTDYAHWQR
ncbi:condensation domain-containing protein, partial [Pseudoalteromonas luteoviolacea]|uniref:condensation domain-containing protein n=1 Tax=Pseudoalteromonas luteoviolacea TaxID=43657 RepID=UPI000B2E6922